MVLKPVLLRLLDSKGEFVALFLVQVLQVQHLVRRLPAPRDAELDHVHAQRLDLLQLRHRSN